MTTKRILITGIAGFIGSNVASTLLNKKFEITGVVRPNTDRGRIKNFSDQIDIVELDLADIQTLKNYLENNRFDVILHIGALRGGRRFSEKIYYNANVNATEQITLSALDTDAVLIFCSSVGVYGAIPKELPANIHTEYQEDNYYHYTKIKSEAIIQKAVLGGLRAYILRPAITYGKNDYGFPYTLIKLIHKKLFFMPDMAIKIHLNNIELLKEVFYKLTEADFKESKIYNVADRNPVELKDLVDFINNNLRGESYPVNREISLNYFRKAEKLARRYKFSNFLNRIKLISYSWYYDVEDTYKDLYLSNINTLSDFKVVVDWYKELKKIRRK